MQKVLVAGGAGFIGSHLCESLLQKGHTVYCLDNICTGNPKNLEELQKNPSFHFIEGDVTQPVKLPQSLHIDAIFHLASPASPNKNSSRSYMNLPLETMLANSEGTYRLLELTKAHSARMLYASSSEVYGDPLLSPQKETYWGNVNPNGPRSVYDEAKRFGEAISMLYVRKFSVDVRVARIFNTYGPRMHPDDGRVVSNFINQALRNEKITIYGDGNQTRSFCFVTDMVNALESLLFLDNLSGKVVNLGNPDERKISELATMIKEMTGSSSEITYSELPQDDPKNRKPDISLAKELLSWEPTVDLEHGLKQTIEFFKN
ncbi:MAG: SDR family oxidoreductase [Candidatus Levybacteria bacterium]|nr:SDR family oxidoreductase [Candidatus Levybacteria bacterium]